MTARWGRGEGGGAHGEVRLWADHRTIASYGRVLNEVLDRLPTSLPRLRRVARKCEDPSHPYRSIPDVQLAVEKRSANQIYIFLCVFIAFMVMLLLWLVFGK